ncbi:MAG: alanine--tRNA ligase-related protein, partial [Dehalococcoidia bacterium]
MDSQEIRDTFLRFFQERGHRVIPSAPLVPVGDPTLLFTSAGMVQFKPYFEGRVTPPSRRLASVQKCFRTSDIDSVGDTAHLTFFEMLGNFSIGDYFKAEAIPWAWELVTDKNWFAIPKEGLWAAVYLDDDEAFDLWRKVGVPAERIVRYGEEHNYWFCGTVGPCGPCSELHYDFGPTSGCPECERDQCHPAVECGRFLEIWNLVFTTYFLHPDGSRTLLPAKNIDTGMGLERMAVVLQDVRSVYETDLFAPIIRRVEELSGCRYGQDEATDRAMRIVGEHTRAAAFLLSDEPRPVVPDNEKQGYALRRILRRVIYRGRELLLMTPARPQEEAQRSLMAVDSEELLRRALSSREERHQQWRSLPLIPSVTETVIEGMSGTYPELTRHREFTLEVVRREEEAFKDLLDRSSFFVETLLDIHRWLRDARTMAAIRGADWKEEFSHTLHSFPTSSAAADQAIQAILRSDEDQARRLENELPGRDVFLLHDTYGFPMELTREIAREQGFTIDEEGFEREMEAHRERARAATHAVVHATDAVLLAAGHAA